MKKPRKTAGRMGSLQLQDLAQVRGGGITGGVSPQENGVIHIPLVGGAAPQDNGVIHMQLVGGGAAPQDNGVLHML